MDSAEEQRAIIDALREHDGQWFYVSAIEVQHVKPLVDAGLIETRVEGRRVQWRLLVHRGFPAVRE